MTKPSLVSIGLAVYNGGQDLQGAFDTLLAQTYPNFELIVSDNASTDGTWEMCQEYAAKDTRIRLYRNAENRGASFNFGRVLELAAGEYFMWAAHDDSWQPDYIKMCVEALEAQPDAALCYTDQLFIDSSSGVERIQHYEMDLRDVSGWRRAYCLLTHRPTPYAIIYGVFRRQALQAAFPIPTTIGPDTVILLQVILRGRFIHVPTVLYSRKSHAKSVKNQMKILLPSQNRISPPILFTRLFFTLWKSAWKSGENLPGKLMIGLGTVRFVLPRLLFETFIRPIRNLRS